MGDRRSTLHLGRLAGVPVGIQPLWLVIVGLITYALGHDYFPQQAPGIGHTAAYALGLLSALGLFAGILAHELGHAVVARRRGMVVDEIDLWLLGGVSRMHGEPEAPGDEIRFALAGPAVTAVLVAVLGLLRLAVGGVAPDWLTALIDYQLYVGAAILVFNLMPAFPLDGGRVVRSLLWRRLGDREEATARAAGVGRVFALVLIALGMVSLAGGQVGGLWLAVIGGFLLVAAGAEEQGVQTDRALHGRTVGDLMTPDPQVLDARLTLDEAVVTGFTRHLFTAFPAVAPDGRAVGLVTLAAVRMTPAPARRSVTVADVMVADPELLVAPALPAADLLRRPAFTRQGRAVVIGPDGHPVGLVSVTDLQRRLRAEQLLPTLRAA